MIMLQNPLLWALVQLAFMEKAGEDIRIEVPELGRLRDAWLSEDGKKVFILHRNYGEHDTHTPDVEKTPNYVAYHSWEDPTYAWWEFDVLDDEIVRGGLEVVMALTGDWITRNPLERYQEIIANMAKPEHADDPDVRRAVSVGEQMMAGLKDAIDSNETREVTSPGGGIVIKPGTEGLLPEE
jgi:hypothetical protein